MTRACYSLALLLVALGGSLVVTSPAKCQTSADDYRFGFRNDETCPFVDGYIQTHGEDFQPVLADDATCDPDLRGRSVVAVLDDPAEAVADNAAAAVIDDQASFGERSFPDSVAVDVQSSETPSTTANSDNQSDMRDSGCYEEYYSKQDYLRDYYQRYRSEYVNPCQPDNVAGNENGCPMAEAETTADVPQYSKPYEAYDYSYHYGGSEAGSCPSFHTEAVVES